MSFLSGGNPRVLVRDLWPHPTLPKDPDNLSRCSSWEVVPNTTHDLSAWLDVVRKPDTPDRSRPFHVIHAVQTVDEDIYEVNLRIQGLVRSANLDPLGDWDGTSYGAMKAVQRLVLCGGTCDAAWLATIQQINNIIALVTRLADRTGDVKLLSENASVTLAFQRRVFTKPRAGKEGRMHSPSQPLSGEFLSSAEALSRLDGDWVLNDSLAIGPGDFVDVLATVEVVQKKATTRVHFNFDRVVQIVPSTSLPAAPTNGSTNKATFDVLRTSVNDVFTDGYEGEDEHSGV